MSHATTAIWIEKTEEINAFLDASNEIQRLSKLQGDQDKTVVDSNVADNDKEDENSIDLDYLTQLVGFEHRVSKYNSDAASSEWFALHNLVQHSHIVKRFRPSTAVWDSYSELEKMRLRGAERSYFASMGKNLKRLGNTQNVEDTLGSSLRSLGMGINLIVGLFLSFLSGFFAAQYTMSLRGSVVPLLIGLLFSIFYIILEVVFLVLYDFKLNKKKAASMTAKTIRREPVKQKLDAPESTGDIPSEATMPEVEIPNKETVLMKDLLEQGDMKEKPMVIATGVNQDVKLRKRC